MDSFERSSTFTYHLNSTDLEFSKILEIYVHHARNIHNICIYDNQDVYAKFSLTYNPDETFSTRIINGGGKNPEFNERLTMKLEQIKAVVKCEIWMQSRARHFMEDQLLGFALVPVSEIIGKEKVTRDYSLSSTDLFHSPAGTITLTLSLNHSNTETSLVKDSSSHSSSISTEIMLLDGQDSQIDLEDPVRYSRIEFPDMNAVTENQKMVTEYFNGLNLKPNSVGIASFLHLGSSNQILNDSEMNLNSNNHSESASIDRSNLNSMFFNFTTTAQIDERNSSPSIEKENLQIGDFPNSSNETNQESGSSRDKPTSKTKLESESDYSAKQEISIPKSNTIGSNRFDQIFNIESEQSAMQKQIVDMYMKSMQQFTMKIPIDFDKMTTCEDSETKLRKPNDGEFEIEKTMKKTDGSRVFYGSRAFF